MIRVNDFSVEIEWFDYRLFAKKRGGFLDYTRQMPHDEYVKQFETDAELHVINGENFVALNNGERYTIRLRNYGSTDADAEVVIDGALHGKFRVPSSKSITISHSAYDINFTHYELNTEFTLDHARQGLIPINPETQETFNIMHITFYPEMTCRGYKSCTCFPPYEPEMTGFIGFGGKPKFQDSLRRVKHEVRVCDVESANAHKNFGWKQHTYTSVPDIKEIDTDNITCISLALAHMN